MQVSGSNIIHSWPGLKSFIHAECSIFTHAEPTAGEEKKMGRKKSAAGPTERFAILELQNPTIREFYEVQTHVDEGFLSSRIMKCSVRCGGRKKVVSS